MTSESLLVLNLERLGVRAQVDLLRDGSLARGVAHLECDLLGLLRALLAVVLATLGLPYVSLNPARDLLLALAGEDGLVECVAPGRVLLLWNMSANRAMMHSWVLRSPLTPTPLRRKDGAQPTGMSLAGAGLTLSSGRPPPRSSGTSTSAWTHATWLFITAQCTGGEPASFVCCRSSAGATSRRALRTSVMSTSATLSSLRLSTALSLSTSPEIHVIRE